MGLTNVDISIKAGPTEDAEAVLEFLVDSGAFRTVVPADTLKQLGVKPVGEQTFRLANGEKIVRRTGDAYLTFGQHSAYSRVVFGEPGDSNLLGVLTLEEFGLSLDPLRRELKPIEMML